jgi:thiol-disulfide isomerase/thioredoxin
MTDRELNQVANRLANQVPNQLTSQVKVVLAVLTSISISVLTGLAGCSSEDAPDTQHVQHVRSEAASEADAGSGADARSKDSAQSEGGAGPENGAGLRDGTVSEDAAPPEKRPEKKAKKKSRLVEQLDVRLIPPSERPDAPDFTLRDVRGNDVRFSDFRGRIVLLDFWATWCMPCRLAVPHLIELQQVYGDRGVEVVGVSVDRNGLMAVLPFMQKIGINYTSLVGGQTIAYKFGRMRSIPTLFIVDRKGRVAIRLEGLQPPGRLAAIVEALLDEA